MENQLITDKEIEMILNESADINFWFYHLGISISEADKTIDKRFSFDFFTVGKNYWNNIKLKIQDIICDKDNKVPKEFINEIINGNVKELVVTIATLLIGTFNWETGIAIPVTSLILKTGIANFCKN